MPQRRWAFSGLAGLIISSAAAASPVSDGNAGLDAMKRGDYAEAVRLFTHALNSRGLSQQDRALAYSERGEAYLQKGDYKAAVDDLQRALRLNPKDKETSERLATARSAIGSPGAGGRSARLAEDQANQGMSALEQGDPSRAIALFNRAIAAGSLSREDVELAYASRGKAYLQAGDNAHAVTDLSTALQMNAADQEASTLLWQALGGLRARSPEAPIDPATCASHVTTSGNFLKGKVYSGWAAYPATSRVDAFAGAYGFLLRQGWTVTGADFAHGILDATQKVPGSPRSISLAVKVDPVAAGSKVSVDETIGGLLIAIDTKGYLCKLLGEVPQG